MHHLVLRSLAPAALVAGLLCGALPGRAASLSCVSINGETVCTSDGTLACRTVDGHMSCVQGPAGRNLEPVPPPDLTAPDRRSRGISIEQHGQKLHIRNGDIDFDIGQ